MNSAGSEPALIGVDWGTTSLRAFLIDTNGQVMDGVSSPKASCTHLAKPLRRSLIASLHLA